MLFKLSKVDYPRVPTLQCELQNGHSAKRYLLTNQAWTSGIYQENPLMEFYQSLVRISEDDNVHGFTEDALQRHG